MKHLNICKQVLFNPKDFFSNLPAGDWFEESLTFLGINSLIMAFFSTLVVFVNQYYPMGSLLVAGITGHKFLVILPVLIALAGNFFVFTFLITGGIFLFVFLVWFFFWGSVLNFFLKSKAVDKLNDAVKSSFYSSAAILGGVFPLMLLVLIKKNLFTFSYFMLIFCLALVFYLYRLTSLAAIRIYADCSKGKICFVNLLPLLLMLIMGGFFALKVLPKLALLIT